MDDVYDLNFHINQVAIRSFRDSADQEYVLARMAMGAGLYSQFRWSALHSLEKYLKSLIILNRIYEPRNGKDKNSNKIRSHDISALVDKVERVFQLKLSPVTRKFIVDLTKYHADDRYFVCSWSVNSRDIFQLDLAVWELRKYTYCDIYSYSDSRTVIRNESIMNEILNSDHISQLKDKFYNGFLGSIIYSDSNKSLRDSLILNNFYFSYEKPDSITYLEHGRSENSPYYLASGGLGEDYLEELLDELDRYIYVPKINRRLK